MSSDRKLATRRNLIHLTKVSQFRIVPAYRAELGMKSPMTTKRRASDKRRERSVTDLDAKGVGARTLGPFFSPFFSLFFLLPRSIPLGSGRRRSKSGWKQLQSTVPPGSGRSVYWSAGGPVCIAQYERYHSVLLTLHLSKMYNRLAWLCDGVGVCIRSDLIPVVVKIQAYRPANSKEMDNAVKQKHLGVPVGEILLGKTVFILGFGAIGVDLAKRLRPFGVKILATKRSWTSMSLPPNGMCDVCLSSVRISIVLVLRLFLSVLYPASGAPNDEIDHLVDKKGGPENLYEFAGEADIVVTCLALNAATVGLISFPIIFLSWFFTYQKIMEISGWYRGWKIPLFNEKG
ncbi:hypothetical protein BHE74_00032945 [Ensete ventricosum]|nr:hypothetical protein GW17_00013145 [Ensete ventricosum]RWW60080.1 hypothetical protein BHE74_00032945 [Ensete ventricosum]